MTSTSVTEGTGMPSFSVLRDQLWQAVSNVDDTHAVALVRHAAHALAQAEGTSPQTAAERVLLELIAPTQERVGVEWAANTITIAQEHAATAINERCVSAVADTAPATPEPAKGRLTVACVDGEWHALPARLVAEVLRLRGWHVDYLGAQVPTQHLIAHLHQRHSDAVLLSSSIPTHLPVAHTAISSCQTAGIPVIAGGAAFGPDGAYARLMQAGWAANAGGADALLTKGIESPTVQAARLVNADLPHLEDQEYTMVRQSRRQLVKQTLVDVEEGFPVMRQYTEYQRERTVEDIDHIVNYLATALYVDDDALFTRFITWTADILVARGVPAVSLLPALGSLDRQLSDFPRATCILATARGALSVPGQRA
ncbi:cobalamin B12-binding domain-containing protein [Streptomyces sp. NPDC001904]|uniref:cobalamin B12-binding domain-containing protein n=1 Tax=Streptomyces sp. NPDC001904 TaxID=3154531 RepID=UPI003332F0F1